MKQIPLRLPDELADKLKTLADSEHRSVNAQIVFLLEKSV